MNLLMRGRRCFCVNLSNYSVIEKEESALRGQMLFRSKNLGVRELDLIVGSWARHNLPLYSHAQLLQFNREVLQHETPQLLKKIMGQTAISAEELLVEQIRQFALDSSFSKIEST